ncbi:MAG TPA: metalloregulator ArsR/SmtB family transcription factor [Vicinamibacterales bacterium]|nr:metalloregulator ArsR/SmtB family transcription factor [Vicinamibacterales bacterium]
MNTYQSAQLDALGDPTRRAILARLISGPLPVGELARDFPVSRPAISQHLRVLKNARLVVDRPAGNRRLYELNPEGIDSLRQYFDQFWTQALAAFKAAAEANTREKRR